MKNRSSLGIVSPVIITVLTFITVTALYWMWAEVKQKRVTDLRSTVSILKRGYELAFYQRELSLVSLGNRMLDIQGPDAEERRQKIGLEALEIYDDLLAIGLANPDGSLLAFIGEVTSEAPNLSKLESTKRSFERAKKSKGICIGEPYYFKQVQDWVLPIRVPLRDDQENLIALNTSGIQYSKLLENLESYGLNQKYRVHAVNQAFNSTLLYYPLELSKYDSLLRKESLIYQNLTESDLGEGFKLLQGYNSFEDYAFIGVQANVKSLDAAIIVSVNSDILLLSFWEGARFILLTYFLLSTATFFILRYINKNEHKNQLAIETEKANLKSLFESTSSIAGLFDSNKKLLAFNAAFANYAKETDNILLKPGLGIEEITKNKEMQQAFNAFQDRALQGEKFKETIEYPTDFGTLCFQLSYNPIHNHLEEVVGLSLFIDDITELKNSQRELERYSEKLEQLVSERTHELKQTNEDLKATNRDLNKALRNLQSTQDQLIRSEKMASLGVLAAGVGHEINNPLNFIYGGIRALEKELVKKNGKEENIRHYMNVIDEGVKRCAAITESLGNYSRQGGDMNENCDIKAILENCLLILHNKLKNRIKVIKEFEDISTFVKGNEGKLHQVFLNILTNAAQAIRESGEIKILAYTEDGRVNIKIRDDGVGISKRNLNKISDPFFTTKGPGEGTGLGLSIAYSIIEDHKGTISCESELNVGTEFTISLPVAMHMN